LAVNLPPAGPRLSLLPSLAVGLSPELLPAIITVTPAGAAR
jgi:hypothetical protein